MERYYTLSGVLYVSLFTSTSGHPVNLSFVMLVIKKVKDLRRVSEAMQIPRDHLTEILEGSEEDSVGKLSEVWLETKKPWKALKEILVKCDELPSAELAYLMEMHISKGKALAIGFVVMCSLSSIDAPLKPEYVFKVLKLISDWSAVWKFLKVGEQPTQMATVSFFVEEPYFEASWMEIALALYNTNQDKAIDALFQYIKSPAG